MIIAVYGAGYVGLVTAVCLATLEYEVICVDIDEEKIALLRAGQCPIHEANLAHLMQVQLHKQRLQFTSNVQDVMEKAHIHFLALGTPSLANGASDLSQVNDFVGQLAQHAKYEGVLVIKSTVPIGTADRIAFEMEQSRLHLGRKTTVKVVSNPEFLREGSAVEDFLNAERIIIGGEGESVALIKKLYAPLTRKGVPLICMTRRSAELTKYAANAFLACKISFINKISQIAEKCHANIDEVHQGICLDKRIGPHFLQAGIGFGGACFPKDISALMEIAKSVSIEEGLFKSIEEVNKEQKSWAFKKILAHFNHDFSRLSQLQVGLWGLAFKPETDDLREAPSLTIIRQLLANNMRLKLYDPVALPSAKKLLSQYTGITWCHSAEAVLDQGVDALLIATEWSEFKTFPLPILQAKLGQSPLIDGRNCFALADVRAAGLSYYYSVGRPNVNQESVVGRPLCNRE